MDRHRYDPQLWASQHHGDVGAARQLGQKFSVAGMAEARLLERLLLNGVGREARDRAASGKRHRTFDGLDRGRCVCRIGMAGVDWRTQAHWKYGQCRSEGTGRLARSRDFLHRHVKMQIAGESAEPVRIVEHEKGTRRRLSYLPCLETEFATDAGRLAHGHGERQGGGHGCLMMSMVAERRMSRM